MSMVRTFMADACALLFAATALAAEVKTEPVPPTPVAANPEQGKALYQRYCSQCHGDEGKGDGPAADRVYPRPRDFTTAIFKVRTTLSGQLPTDHDLFKVISEGLPGTSMPAWKKYLTEGERWQLVHHVKTFDMLGLFEEEPAKERVVIDTPPAVTPELIAKGEELYQQKKCWQCHGKFGRGDGPSAAGMKDEWGHPIRPVNFSKGWRFRGGDRLEDIYRTFTTGFNGTPMPSFVNAVPEAADRWALAAYVKSLSRPQKNGQVLVAGYVDGDLPGDPYDPAWDGADYVDFPLAGQIIIEPRWFTPAHDVVTARALYNDREAALMLEWDDGTHNVGGDGKPADEVAVQLPAAEPNGNVKPYFILGDAKHGVDYWRWSGSGALTRVAAKGHDRQEPRDAGALAARGEYRDGQYRVILRRPLAADAGEIGLAPGKFVPIAFHLRDGEHGEEGMKMALSTWYYLLLQPKTPFTVYLWPLALVFLALLGEWWLVRRLRRKPA
ncbi:c-type cytochrome [Sulfurivermis fontis]|uniref:c-type cytochrome n=1 Tax=Sulfurivermis fontis TaxID=1972068 RepID=UPI000FDC973D|nr:c-type cytochrome [Sulfurivermis fontis]